MLSNSLSVSLRPKETREKTMKILNNGPSGVGQFLTLNLLKNDFTRVVVTKKLVKHVGPET